MRILVYSWRDPEHPLAGGAEQVMHEHMKGWIEAGCGVTLFSSKMKGLRPHEVMDGVEIVRKGYQYLGVQVAGFFYFLKNKESFDFVVDQFHGFPFFTPMYTGKPKLAVIQEPARNVWFLNPLPQPLKWIVGAIGYAVEPLLFLFYKKTQFMTGSASAKEDVAKLGIPEKNITVVSHGVIIKKSKIKFQKSKIKTVVFLGILSKDKGIEEALRCFSLLNQKGNYNFWVIGRAETEKYMKLLLDLCRRLGIEEKTKFWGFVSQKKKFELLARGHVLVNPSVHEGWGLVNIEANAMATPVVAYRSPGLVDSVKDGQSGILSKEDTPEELAKDTSGLLENKKLYRKLQKGAYDWSKNFSWKKSRRLSLELINHVYRRPC